MYTRLNSNRLPMQVMNTENEYIISKDKSSVLLTGQLEEGSLKLLPISLNRHAIHLITNPKLGGGVAVYTPDDGEFTPQVRVTKAKADLVGELDWHFKVAIVRIDLPALRD